MEQHVHVSLEVDPGATDKHQSPYVSREADRRAYEALQNIHRAHRWRLQMDALIEAQDRFATELVVDMRIRLCTTGELSEAISRGQRALACGIGFDDVYTQALQLLGVES